MQSLRARRKLLFSASIPRILTLLACALLASAQDPPVASLDVLTANYDLARTNCYRAETKLTTENVGQDAFGKLFSLPVDGYIYAQPLYLHQFPIGDQARDILYAATMHNSVYAFDTESGEPLWHVNLGPAIPNTIWGEYYDVKPEIGILSTPVIDRHASLLYVVSTNLEGEGDRYRFLLHALDLATGAEMLEGPVEIAGKDEAKDLPFDPFQHIQRPGLALADGVLYIAFGSHGDMVPFNGWLFAYDARNLTQIKVLSTTPVGGGGAIWQSGRAPAVGEDGSIFLTTGNGVYDPLQDGWSDSVLRLGARDLTVQDHFTPIDQVALSRDDLDVGASGPVLVPGTNVVAAGGKSGTVYLLDRAALGHQQENDAGAASVLPAGSFGLFNLATWRSGEKTLLYARGIGQPLRAWRIRYGHFIETPDSEQNPETAPQFPSDGLAVSANGDAPGTGIVWMTAVDEPGHPAPGTLYAYDASDVSRELWNSSTKEEDRLGMFAKFANPTVANGRVYVPTFSGEIVVYGLKQAASIE